MLLHCVRETLPEPLQAQNTDLTLKTARAHFFLAFFFFFFFLGEIRFFGETVSRSHASQTPTNGPEHPRMLLHRVRETPVEMSTGNYFWIFFGKYFDQINSKIIFWKFSRKKIKINNSKN